MQQEALCGAINLPVRGSDTRALHRSSPSLFRRLQLFYCGLSSLLNVARGHPVPQVACKLGLNALQSPYHFHLFLLQYPILLQYPTPQLRHPVRLKLEGIEAQIRHDSYQTFQATLLLVNRSRQVVQLAMNLIHFRLRRLGLPPTTLSLFNFFAPAVHHLADHPQAKQKAIKEVWMVASLRPIA